MTITSKILRLVNSFSLAATTQPQHHNMVKESGILNLLKKNATISSFLKCYDDDDDDDVLQIHYDE